MERIIILKLNYMEFIVFNYVCPMKNSNFLWFKVITQTYEIASSCDHSWNTFFLIFNILVSVAQRRKTCLQGNRLLFQKYSFSGVSIYFVTSNV